MSEQALCLRSLFLSALLVCLPACSPREEQYIAEGQTAHKVVSLLQMFQIENPGTRPTNLIQLFGGENGRYPHAWHQRFQAYGKDAGFTNSIFEKYLFLPNGITNRLIQGEALVMNAQPFSNAQGRGRIVISRVGLDVNDYRRTWIEENRIQGIFAQLGVEIPTQVSMPLPPSKLQPGPLDKEMQPPPFFAITSAIDNFASIYGLNGPTLRYALPAVAAVLFLFVTFWLWRRSRR